MAPSDGRFPCGTSTHDHQPLDHSRAVWTFLSTFLISFVWTGLLPSPSFLSRRNSSKTEYVRTQWSSCMARQALKYCSMWWRMLPWPYPFLPSRGRSRGSGRAQKTALEGVRADGFTRPKTTAGETTAAASQPAWPVVVDAAHGATQTHRATAAGHSTRRRSVPRGRQAVKGVACRPPSRARVANYSTQPSCRTRDTSARPQGLA
ncbi:uncharacterized protein PFL1_05497 [Pseudozyma flocculosa PF-1]|uniref:Uncharacterized protein n=1 Tax=Pseudozyma flocculosa PF-1 TaxID=1277687 RepID=A0A061H2B2_9BASI|nr:uncharacterized protein PFL1_05497 [Pseudozyma flocculosa PF-1]EPQ26862.1 hypothetical protein PFL1_05497 [Pseudozyma flocculosa PF-1]